MIAQFTSAAAFRCLMLSILMGACTSKRIEESSFNTFKPDNIPDSAFWCGGIDGGNWYYVHSIHPHRNNAVISVYNDQDGSLIMKKRFLLICNIQKPTSIYDLKNQISSFDGEKIYFKQTDGEKCWLQPQR